jgi:hypothetical protein
MALGMSLFAGGASFAAARMIVDERAENAVLLAGILATCNGVAALALAQTGGRAKSTKGFFGAVFGGMVLRMATTLVGFLAAVKVLLLPATPFAVALLVFTALFTAAEVILWSRQTFSPKVELS